MLIIISIKFIIIKFTMNQYEIIQKLDMLNKQISNTFDQLKEQPTQLHQYANQKLIQIKFLQQIVISKNFRQEQNRLNKLKSILEQMLTLKNKDKFIDKESNDQYQTIKLKYQCNKKYMQSLLNLNSHTYKKRQEIEWKEEQKVSSLKHKYKNLKTQFNQLLGLCKKLQKQLKIMSASLNQEKDKSEYKNQQNKILKETIQHHNKQIKQLKQTVLIKIENNKKLQAECSKMNENLEILKQTQNKRNNMSLENIIKNYEFQIQELSEKNQEELQNINNKLDKKHMKAEKLSKQNEKLIEINLSLKKQNKEIKEKFQRCKLDLQQQKNKYQMQINHTIDTIKKQRQNQKNQIITYMQKQKELTQQILNIAEKYKIEKQRSSDLQKQLISERKSKEKLSAEIKQNNNIMENLRELMDITQNLKQELKKVQKENSILKQNLYKQQQVEKTQTKTRIIDQIHDMIKLHKINMKH